MKYLVLFVAIAANVNAYAQANTKLSNLVAPTAVNQDLLPSANSVRSFGSTTLSWKNFYFNGSIYKGKNRFLASPGTGNTFLGIQAGKSNTSGAYNTVMGDSAFFTNTSGFSNTAVGVYALAANNTGHNNTAGGRAALYYNTTGSYNTAYGMSALQSNIDGYNNTANGFGALNFNTYGNDNTANGDYALYYNTYGDYNIAVGSNALYYNTNGRENTAVGFGALTNNKAGYQNIAIGYNSGTNPNTPDIYNTISIGNDNLLNAYQNQAFIGNTSMTFIGGVVTWSTYSDARIKNIIQEDVKGLDFIMRLRPVTYHISTKAITAITDGKETPDYPGKYDAEKIKRSGFIAQEVEKAAKESGYDFSGYSAPKNQWSLYSISYEEFVVPLVKAVQELSKINDTLKMQNEAQHNINISLQNQIDELKAMIKGQSSGNLSTAALLQNAPNPVSGTTIISYTIPQQFASAKLVITDKLGKTLRIMNLTTGRGSVNVDVSALAAGTYQYTLFADNKMIDSKSMVVAK